MRGVVFVLGLFAMTLGEPVEVQRYYHEAVGMPEAARIKAAEEEYIRSAGPVFKQRIIGGAFAPENAHPYLGGVIISLVGIPGNSVCGSSLLSANRLVTAAHCWFDGRFQAWQFQIVLGTQFLFFGIGPRPTTSQVVMHPFFDFRNFHNDVAIIYLSTRVTFSHAVHPIALPAGSLLWESFAGWWGIASGYGMTNDHEQGVPIMTQVSHVNLQVMTVAQCTSIFGSVFVQPSTICTNGAGGVGICGGDSGGPLVMNPFRQPVLVGISSFVALAGCELGFPSGFARVTSYINFILSHM